MKWPFIMQSTRDLYHARCNMCASNVSVAAGGANDIVKIYHLSLTENVLQGYKNTDFAHSQFLGSLEYWKV